MPKCQGCPEFYLLSTYFPVLLVRFISHFISIYFLVTKYKFVDKSDPLNPPHWSVMNKDDFTVNPCLLFSLEWVLFPRPHPSSPPPPCTCVSLFWMLWPPTWNLPCSTMHSSKHLGQQWLLSLGPLSGLNLFIFVFWGRIKEFLLLCK